MITIIRNSIRNSIHNHFADRTRCDGIGNNSSRMSGVRYEIVICGNFRVLEHPGPPYLCSNVTFDGDGPPAS
jgi:hypothetical protein